MIVYKCIYLKSPKYLKDLLTLSREALDRLTAKYFITISSSWLDIARVIFCIWQLHYAMVYLEI